MKQLTGRSNYNSFNNGYKEYWWSVGTQDFLTSPDLLLQMPFALRSGVWFWASNKCMKEADKGISNDNIDAVTRIVNPGEVGTPDGNTRRTFSQEANKIFN